MTTLTTSSTATAPTTSTSSTSTMAGRRRTGLLRATAASGAAAATATVLVAAAARAAGIPLEVAGEPIPLPGFATATVAGVLVGLLLAAAVRRWASRPARTFAVTTLVLTALSLVPDAIVDATTGSKLVLMLTHLVAAAIAVPALTTRLPRR